MNSKVLIAFGISVGIAVGLEGCGSDEDESGPTPTDDSGTGGTAGDASVDGGGSGGRGGGGSGGGPGGSGGAGPACDRAPCQAQVDQVTADAAMLAALVTTCCQSATLCGVEVAVAMTGCVDPSMFISDGGFSFGSGLPVLDGGIVDVPDGGADIHLNESCDDIPVENPLAPITLPGCCTPSGECGGSTHVVQGLPVPIPLDCMTHEAIEMSSIGMYVTLPPDPMQTCTYESSSSPEAGPAGDGG